MPDIQDISRHFLLQPENPEAMKEIGINYAAQQIIDQITNGVDGIHIYTMNRAETAQRVFDSIPAVLKELN